MPQSIERVAEQLSWELESWKSIEIQSSDEFVSMMSGNDPQHTVSGRIEEHYIETSIGQRVYDTLIQSPIGGEHRSVSYCDSKKCAVVEHPSDHGLARKQVVIKRAFGPEDMFGFTYRPVPIQYYYVGKIPLQKAILQAVKSGENRVLGRDCDRYLFTNVTWGSGPSDMVYSLDRATSIPLKVEFFRDQEARERNQPTVEWEAQSFDQVEGRHLPLKSQLTKYSYDSGQDAEKNSGGSQARSVTSTRHYKVDSLSFDKSYPASTFWPTIDEGTNVFDYITGAHPIPTSSKKYTEMQHASTDSMPVLALPPSDYAGVFSGVGIALGVVLLSTALLLTLRGRRSQV